MLTTALRFKWRCGCNKLRLSHEHCKPYIGDGGVVVDMSMQQVNTGAGTHPHDIRLPEEQCLMHLVLYDGQCPLCYGAVRFLLRIDRLGKLMYAPLQGETARAMGSLWQHKDDHIIFISHLATPEEKVLDKSDAVLELLRLVGGWWRVFTVAAVIPRRIRNMLYDAIARRRTRWFGRYAEGECPVPPASMRSRFLP